VTQVREAATLMLVDDRPDLHVFMLRRNPRSVFGPGAYVFPGGAVDPADSDDAITNRVIGLDDGRASALLGLASGSGGLRVWIAALREAFEEAGILLVAPEAGAASTADDDPILADDRIRLNAGEVGLADLLARHGLLLDANQVFLFSHWLTPEGAPRRYDTWFLVAPAPRGQEGSHDDAELVHSEWVRPSDALARYAAGEIDLIFPTLRTLRVLESFESATALLDAVRAANHAADGAPLVVPDFSGQRIALAADDGALAVEGWRSLTSRPDLDTAGMLAEKLAQKQFGQEKFGQKQGVA
jgi:8-oxo-dGTP pyrophosphatase MutT (NUDIX family)